MKKFFSHLLLLVAVACAVSCSTGDRQIETPQGTRSADQTGPWEILGVISRNTSSLSQPNGRDGFSEDIKINVPPGTQIIIPALRGYLFGYGSTDPADLSTPGATDQRPNWHTEDHNLGYAAINIFVKDIDAVDNSTTPATQTATVTIQANISDENGDDNWWADVNYNLLCLGKKINPRGIPLDTTIMGNR